jgi:hypothetical protein
MTIAFGMAVVGGWWGLKIQRQVAERQLQAGVDNPGGRLLPGEFAPNVSVITPRPMLARLDAPLPWSEKCLIQDGGFTPVLCRWGPVNADVHIAIVGSSHSAHWLPAVRAISERRGWRVSATIKAACLFGEGDFSTYADRTPNCGAWNRRVMEWLEVERPDVVLTLATYSAVTLDDVPPVTVTAWRRVGRAGIRVLALRDTIWLPFDVQECVIVRGADAAACAVPRPSKRLSPPSGGWPDNVTVVDTMDWVCGPRLCPPVIGGVLVYSDRNHLTATFARSLDGRLEPYLTAVVDPQ